MSQTINTDPELWARVRMASFRRKTTATKIVTAALIEHLDKLDAEDAIQPTVKTKAAPATNHAVYVAPDGSVTDPVDPVGGEMTVSAKISGPLPWTRIDTPEDAAKVAAFVPAFNPVPKPGATKKARAR